MRFLDKSQKSRLSAGYKVKKIIDVNRDVEFTLKKYNRQGGKSYEM